MSTTNDFLTSVPHFLLERIQSILPEHCAERLMLDGYIARGFQREQEMITMRAKWDLEAKKEQEAQKWKNPEVATAEINRIKNLYNLSWQWNCDLVSAADGIIWYGASGEFIVTTPAQPASAVQLLREYMADGKLGEEFVGPRFVAEDEDE